MWHARMRGRINIGFLVEISEGKRPLRSSTRPWEKTLTWRWRIGIIWLGIGICGGPFDRAVSLKGPRNEGTFWFF